MKKTIKKEGCSPAARVDSVAVMGEYIPAEVTFITVEPGCYFLNVSITSPEDMVTVSGFEAVKNDADDEYFDLNLN